MVKIKQYKKYMKPPPRFALAATPSPPQSPAAWLSSHHPIRSQALVRLARPEGIALPAQMGSASCGGMWEFWRSNSLSLQQSSKCVYIYGLQRYIISYIIQIIICYICPQHWISGCAISEYFVSFRHPCHSV